MLRNWILGFLAISIWTLNYLVYFAPDILAWLRRRKQEELPAASRFARAPTTGFTGPLPPHQRVRFPSEPPAPVPSEAAPDEGAEVIAFPRRRRPRPSA